MTENINPMVDAPEIVQSNAPPVSYALPFDPQLYQPRTGLSFDVMISNPATHYLDLQVSRFGYFSLNIGEPCQTFYTARLDSLQITNMDSNPRNFLLKATLYMTIYATILEEQIRNPWFNHDIPATFRKLFSTTNLAKLTSKCQDPYDRAYPRFE